MGDRPTGPIICFSIVQGILLHCLDRWHSVSRHSRGVLFVIVFVQVGTLLEALAHADIKDYAVT